MTKGVKMRSRGGQEVEVRPSKVSSYANKGYVEVAPGMRGPAPKVTDAAKADKKEDTDNG